MKNGFSGWNLGFSPLLVDVVGGFVPECDSDVFSDCSSYLFQDVTSLIACFFVGYIFRFTTSFLHVALKDSAAALS